MSMSTHAITSPASAPERERERKEKLDDGDEPFPVSESPVTPKSPTTVTPESPTTVTPESYIIPDPVCIGMHELPGTSVLRARVSRMMFLRDMERLRVEDEIQSQSQSQSHSSSRESEDVNADEAHLQSRILNYDDDGEMVYDSPLYNHLAHGLAYTTGSALALPSSVALPPSSDNAQNQLTLQSIRLLLAPPTYETCLAAYLLPNKVGLTAGARAWCKHAHRSIPSPSPSISPSPSDGPTPSTTPNPHSRTDITSALSSTPSSQSSLSPPSSQTSSPTPPPPRKPFWYSFAQPTGPQSVINANALLLFHKVMDKQNATWRNLHWLPHQVLVYEVRVKEGWGMRWARDLSSTEKGGLVVDISEVKGGSGAGEQAGGGGGLELEHRPWIFRGFLEPPMENGHEVGWRHPVS